MLEVQVSLHIRDFAVPEVELVPLLRVILLHEGDAPVHIPLRSVFLLEAYLQLVEPLLHGVLVGVEGSAQLLSSRSLLLCLHFFKLELLQALLNFILLVRIVLKAQLVLLLPPELNLLEVL